MKDFLHIFLKCIMIFTLLTVSCLNDPVGEDYFNDTSRIKGGEKPDTPAIWIDTSDPVYPNQCENQVTFKFCCNESGACINDADSCGTDAEGNEQSFYLYASSADPSGFEPSDFFNLYYLYGEVLITEDMTITYNGSATFYFWLTAWDGGRQSDQSNVVAVTFPSATACPEATK